MSTQSIKARKPVRQKLHHTTFDHDVEKLLDQIGQGIKEYEVTNFEKLKLAQDYGPVLLQLKAKIPHGQFQKVLEERYRPSYHICRRWMFIARHESEVAQALETYPKVAWGPMKMIDFLNGKWKPEDDTEVDEDACLSVDSDDLDEARQFADTDPASDESDDQTDDEPEPDNTDKWKTLINETKAEAATSGTEVVLDNDYTITVSVQSQREYDAIVDSLSQWRSQPSIGKKSLAFTFRVSPTKISELMKQLGEILGTHTTQIRIDVSR